MLNLTFRNDQAPALNATNMNSIVGEINRSQEMVADEYDPTSAYAVGDYCIYSGSLYLCVAAIGTGGEAWTAAHWVEVNVTGEISDVKNALATNQNYMGSKNLLKVRDRTDEKSGVTFLWENGVATISGTASDDISYIFEEIVLRAGVTYKLLYPVSGALVSLGTLTGSGIKILYEYTTNFDFSVPEDGLYIIRLVISSGAVFSDVVYRPMIMLAGLMDENFVPYVPSNRNLADNIDETYTKLTGRKIDGMTKNVELAPIQTEEGKMWNNRSGTLDNEADYHAKKYLCTPYDMITITGIQTNTYKLASFYDEDGVLILDTWLMVSVSSGEKTITMDVPSNARYMWVNGSVSFSAAVTKTIFDTDPNHLLETKMDALTVQTDEVPVDIEEGYLWKYSTSELVENENYTAYKYDCVPGKSITISGVQPSINYMLACFYDSENNLIETTSSSVDTGSGKKSITMNVPSDAVYVWVNTMIDGGIVTTNYEPDPTKLLPLQITKTAYGFYIQSGSLKIYFRTVGANNIFNLYALWYKDQILFSLKTDWLGPYNVEKIEGSGDFETTQTTGGNHDATDGVNTVRTGETIFYDGYADGVKCTEINKVYGANRFVMEWHNEILAGNDIKLTGTNTPFLDEYYRVTVEPDMRINIQQYFVPRYDGKLNWYSGLQFAVGSSVMPNIIIPQYTNEVITTRTINSYSMDYVVVDHYRAFGETVSVEMGLDRKFGLPSNSVKSSVTGNGGKAYLTQQGYADEPLDLIAGRRYCWNGYYHFYKTF